MRERGLPQHRRAIYWVPVVAPGNLMFYRGTQTFPQWNGNGFISGMGTQSHPGALIHVTPK